MRGSKIPNRICIVNEEELPDCIDVYTNDYGSSNVAKRYIPEQTGNWIPDDKHFHCSGCFGVTDVRTEYCPSCGTRMCHK